VAFSRGSVPLGDRKNDCFPSESGPLLSAGFPLDGGNRRIFSSFFEDWCLLFFLPTEAAVPLSLPLAARFFSFRPAVGLFSLSGVRRICRAFPAKDLSDSPFPFPPDRFSDLPGSRFLLSTLYTLDFFFSFFVFFFGCIFAFFLFFFFFFFFFFFVPSFFVGLFSFFVWFF